MSYPISAGTLSKALEGTPQFNELSVTFHASCQDPRKLENPCRVLSIGYFYQRVSLSIENKTIEQGWCGAKWEITVYPVPRACVSAVRNRLEEEGLDKIRQWLYSYQDVTGKDGHCWLHLLYNMDVSQLSYNEQDKLIDLG